MRWFAFFALLILIFPRRAYAYIDPGTGSIIIQFLIGIAVGGAALIKVFWRKISTNVQNLFRKNAKKETR